MDAQPRTSLQSPRRRATLAVLGAIAAVAGCSQPERAASTDPAPPPRAAATEPPPSEPAEHLPQSPMTARLVIPDRVPAAGELELRLDLTRSNPTLAPISVSLQLPAGSALVAGDARSSITETTSTAITRTWRIRYTTLPAADATVVVDWRTNGAGFHAELPYRFGRQEPKQAEPQRMPVETRLPGGVSLGRPILTR